MHSPVMDLFGYNIYQYIYIYIYIYIYTQIYMYVYVYYTWFDIPFLIFWDLLTNASKTIVCEVLINFCLFSLSTNER